MAASKLKNLNPHCKNYVSFTIQILRDSEKTKSHLFTNLNLALQIQSMLIFSSLKSFEKFSRFTEKKCDGIHVCVFNGPPDFAQLRIKIYESLPCKHHQIPRPSGKPLVILSMAYRLTMTNGISCWTIS